MSHHQIWCDALGRALLASLPEEAIVKHWGPISTDTSDPHARLGDHFRQDLLTWAREDDEVRRWALGAWREAHPDVVAAADQAVIEGLTGDAVRVLASFPPEDAVLALLTDEFDDGRELATTFARRVDDGGPRRALFGALARLAGDHVAAAGRRGRVVIIGGRQRDENTVGQRLFEGGPFDVRWRAFEKKSGTGGVQKEVAGVLRNAEAVIIITGAASHMLAHYAKDCAKRFGLRWRCVERASELVLKGALDEMFPELTEGRPCGLSPEPTGERRPLTRN
jgi:hypothetical protein